MLFEDIIGCCAILVESVSRNSGEPLSYLLSEIERRAALVKQPNIVLSRRPYTDACKAPRKGNFLISGLYQGLTKSDWRISIKAYPRNKSLKVTLASRRAGRHAVVLTTHPGP